MLTLPDFMKYIVRPPTLEDYAQINDLGRWFQDCLLYTSDAADE